MGGSEDLCVTVPSYFRCPITLDVMKSPVSLSTGVTYERSSIQRWLDAGNTTCPATMQVLHTKDLVPNHTLQRLIHIWTPSSSSLRPTKPSADPFSPQPHLLPKLVQQTDEMPQDCLEHCLSNISRWGRESNENLKFLAGYRGLAPGLINILARGGRNAGLYGEVVMVLELIAREYEDRTELKRLMFDRKDCLCPILLLVLQRGTLESKLACVSVLERVAIDVESKLRIADNDDLIVQLLALVGAEKLDATTVEACLSCLISISIPKRVKTQIVRLGAVKSLANLLSHSSLSVSGAEKALKLLEMVSSCREGRRVICGDYGCVAAVLHKTLKASSAATEHAVTILWSLCYLFRDHKAQEAVTNNNGLTKMLLLMQTNCSPVVRQMSGDLIKIFRVTSKSHISSYHTNTAHIMPF